MSRSPFLIDGPAVVSFSGGRTSGEMLRRILDAHDDELPDDVFVMFENTGAEDPRTLAFVHEVESRWGVAVVWLEYRGEGELPARVSFLTASRHREPFDILLGERLQRARKILPNVVARFCTQKLKLHLMRDWMVGQGYDHWTNVSGIRADEPGRVATARAPKRERWDTAVPLADAGVTKADVLSAWAARDFDLGLREWEGNCDLCFLKNPKKRVRLMRDYPERAAWWIEWERRFREAGGDESGSRFSKHQPGYANLFAQAGQPMLDVLTDEALASEPDMADCTCAT